MALCVGIILPGGMGLLVLQPPTVLTGQLLLLLAFPAEGVVLVLGPLQTALQGLDVFG